MDADLTFNSVVFKKAWDDPDKGSLRQSIARGINTPDKLIVKSQDYVDSATGVAGRRYTSRVDRVDIDANVKEIISSLYFVVAVPKTVTQAQLDVVVATFKAVVADANFVSNVLAGQL
jgi:hypothetical protein